MALNIGSNVYRNVQEQVAFLTEQYKAIMDVIDGLDIADNVIAIDSMSDILTADELTIVRKAVAFIVYNGQLYIKQKEDTTYAYFDVVFSVSVSTVISFASSEIKVTLGSGALSIVNISTSTYTSTEIDNKLSTKANLLYVDTELAKKANLSGANFTGPVTATTLKQTQVEAEVAFNFISGSGDIQLTNAYNRAIVINNVLYLIANIKMKNISGNSKYIGGAWGGTPYIAFSLPNDVASKIYDIDGVSAADAGTPRKLITSVHASCVSGTLGEASAKTYNDFRLDFTNTGSTNNVACYFNSDQYITLADQEEICLMSRIAITLLP